MRKGTRRIRRAVLWWEDHGWQIAIAALAGAILVGVAILAADIGGGSR